MLSYTGICRSETVFNQLQTTEARLTLMDTKFNAYSTSLIPDLQHNQSTATDERYIQCFTKLLQQQIPSIQTQITLNKDITNTQ